MSKISLSICLAFAFFVATAVAQMAPGGGGQGTQGSSPSAQQPGSYPSQQPGTAEPGTPGASQTDQGSTSQNRADKGERKLKGCVQSQGGQYVLETKKGKAVALAGQDVSGHVGHEVAVKGNWESGGAGGGMSSTSSGNASGSQKTFNVTSVEMISESCGGKGKGSSGSMGTSPSGSNPSSTNPGGTSTQPPQ